MSVKVELRIYARQSNQNYYLLIAVDKKWICANFYLEKKCVCFFTKLKKIFAVFHKFLSLERHLC